jgi:hypothetical protein
MKHASFPKFHSFFETLVRTAVSKGIAHEDARDLAGDAVEKALTGFDPARGEFAAYCHTILVNLIKNHWRDKKKTEEYVEEGLVDPDTKIDLLELAETMRDVRAALSDIARTLSADENIFLKHLQDVLDESGPRAISEAARRSGLTPAKGWDVFRKIQRKARALPLGRDLEEAVMSEATMIPAPLLERAEHVVRSDSRDPLERFTSDQLRMVEALLP